MTSADRRGLLPIAQIHKKKYFGASRTWHVWNKLTARDVFALTQMPHYEGIVENTYLVHFATFVLHQSTHTHTITKTVNAQANTSISTKTIQSNTSTCAA